MGRIGLPGRCRYSGRTKALAGVEHPAPRLSVRSSRDPFVETAPMNWRGSGAWEDLDARPMVAGRPFGERAVFFSCLQRAGAVGRPRQHDMTPRRGFVPVHGPLDPGARSQRGPGACFAPGVTAIQTRLDTVDAAVAGEGDSADL